MQLSYNRTVSYIMVQIFQTFAGLFSCENSQLPGFGLFFQEKQTELPVFWVVWSSMQLAMYH